MEINGIAQKITRIALFNLPGTFIFLPIFHLPNRDILYSLESLCRENLCEKSKTKNNIYNKFVKLEAFVICFIYHLFRIQRLMHKWFHDY